MKRKLILVCSVLVLVLGVSIMLYPTVSSLINARHQSQVISQYIEEVDALTEEEIAALMAAADQYNERLRTSSIVLTDPFDEEAKQVVSADYGDTLNVDGTGLMAYIDIPAIGVHLPIYHGTGQSVLSRAVGHLEGTSLPVGGEGTHSVLSAHTGLANARLFTDLDELEEGDTFTITVLDEVLTYQVYDIDVVEPHETSSLTIREGEDLCTLVTCTPYGVNSHRLLVHGTRIPTPEEEEETVRQELNLSPRYLIAGGALALAAVILLVRQARKEKRRRERIRELWKQIRGG